jgi:AAA domain
MCRARGETRRSPEQRLHFCAKNKLAERVQVASLAPSFLAELGSRKDLFDWILRRCGKCPGHGARAGGVTLFWPAREVAMLDGDPGMGKSLLALDLCARLSTGKPFLGWQSGYGPGLVHRCQRRGRRRGYDPPPSAGPGRRSEACLRPEQGRPRRSGFAALSRARAHPASGAGGNGGPIPSDAPDLLRGSSRWFLSNRRSFPCDAPDSL